MSSFCNKGKLFFSKKIYSTLSPSPTPSLTPPYGCCRTLRGGVERGAEAEARTGANTRRYAVLVWVLGLGLNVKACGFFAFSVFKNKCFSLCFSFVFVNVIR